MARVAYDVFPVGIDTALYEQAACELALSPQQRLASYGRLLHYKHDEIACYCGLSTRTIKGHGACVARKCGDPRRRILERMTVLRGNGAVREGLLREFPFNARVELGAMDQAARDLGLSRQQRRVSIGRALFYTHDDLPAFLGIHVRTIHLHWSAAKTKLHKDGPTLLRELIVAAYAATP